MTNSDIFKKDEYDSLKKQVGGKHYKRMKLQPAEFINENKLNYYLVGNKCGVIQKVKTTIT